MYGEHSDLILLASRHSLIIRALSLDSAVEGDAEALRLDLAGEEGEDLDEEGERRPTPPPPPKHVLLHVCLPSIMLGMR